MKHLILLTLAIALSLSACKPAEKVKTPETPKTPEAVKVVETPKAPKAPQTPEKATITPAEGGGKWVTSKTYPVKFRVPENWTVKIEDDGISAVDADESTTVILVGSESTGMIQGAINDVKKKVKIKDAKFDKSGNVVLNGLPGQNIFGTAVIEKKAEDGETIDEEIQFVAYNLKVGSKAVTLMIFSEATMYEAKKETIMGLAQTLTKS